MVGLLTTFLAIVVLPESATAGGNPEAELIQMLNAERERAGLEPLQVHWDLEDDARRQAQRMRSEGRTSSIEDISRVTVGWTSLRQYAAFGESSRVVHQQAMQNAGHHASVYGDFDHVGIGVARSDEGNLWVAMIFMRSCPTAGE